MFCSCRLDQFEKVLRQSAELHPDVILVEASGLSDPTGVRKLFSQTDRFPHIDYQGAVCLVDAVRFPKIYATARTCMKQLASSDIAVINKTDLASEEQLAQTRDLLHGQRPDMPVIETTFGTVSAEILDALARAKALPEDNMPLTADLTLRKLTIVIAPTITSYELQKLIEMFAEYTFRVKGFIRTAEGLRMADCVGNVVSVKPCEQFAIPPERIGRLNVLSGAGMPVRKAVREACSWYQTHIIEMI